MPSALVLLGHALWIIGSAVLLTVFSFAWWAAGGGWAGLRPAARRLVAPGAPALTLFLIALGGALTAGSLPEAALWGVGALWALLRGSRVVGRGSDGQSPVASRVPAVPLRDGLRPAGGDQSSVDQPEVAIDTQHATRNTQHTIPTWFTTGALIGVAALAPFALFQTSLGAWPLLGLAVWMGARTVLVGRPVPATPLDAPLALIALMIVVSLWATPDLGQSLPAVARLVYGLAVYYALVDWAAPSPRRFGWALGGTVAAGVGLAGIALLGTNWGVKSDFLARLTEHLPGFFRTLATDEGGFNPNVVGGALLWPLPLALALLVVRRHSSVVSPSRFTFHVSRVALALAAALMAVVIVLAQSRNALLGLGVAGVGVLAGAGRWGRALIVAGVVMACVGAVLVGPARVADSLGSLGAEFNPVDAGRSAQGRNEIWGRAVTMIGDFPLTGTGMNMFRTLLPVVYPRSVTPAPGDRALPHAHDQWLQAALDLGLPGLVGYLACWLGGAALAWRSGRLAPPGSLYRATALGLGLALFTTALFGLTDSVVLTAKPGGLFWVVLALCVVLHKNVV